MFSSPRTSPRKYVPNSERMSGSVWRMYSGSQSPGSSPRRPCTTLALSAAAAVERRAAPPSASLRPSMPGGLPARPPAETGGGRAPWSGGRGGRGRRGAPPAAADEHEGQRAQGGDDHEGDQRDVAPAQAVVGRRALDDLEPDVVREHRGDERLAVGRLVADAVALPARERGVHDVTVGV